MKRRLINKTIIFYTINNLRSIASVNDFSSNVHQKLLSTQMFPHNIHNDKVSHFHESMNVPRNKKTIINLIQYLNDLKCIKLRLHEDPQLIEMLRRIDDICDAAELRGKRVYGQVMLRGLVLLHHNRCND